MKFLIALLALTSINAYAADDTKVCEDLYDEAIHNCSVFMCEESIEEAGEVVTPEAVNNCIANSDGDLMEGAQICAVDGEEYKNVIEAYNAKNPAGQVTCEDN